MKHETATKLVIIPLYRYKMQKVWQRSGSSQEIICDDGNISNSSIESHNTMVPTDRSNSRVIVGASENESSIAMQGFMMKKKQAALSSRSLLRRTVGAQWITRYFILYKDGKLVYHRERPTTALKVGDISLTATDEGAKPDGIICGNVAECRIHRVRDASDLAGEMDKDAMRVANSFYVVVPRTGSSTLLVTRGPAEHKEWFMSFRKMKASVPQSTRLLDVGGADISAGTSMPTDRAAELEKFRMKQAKELAEQEQKQKELEYAETTTRILKAEQAEKERASLERDRTEREEQRFSSRSKLEKMERKEREEKLERERLAAKEDKDRAKLEILEKERKEEEKALATHRERQEEAEKDRLEAERLDNEQGLAAERSRLEAEERARSEVEARLAAEAAEQQAELERLKRLSEQQRLLDEQKMKEAEKYVRLLEAKKVEEDLLAAKQRLEQKQMAAEKKAEIQRLEKKRVAEQKRKEAEEQVKLEEEKKFITNGKSKVEDTGAVVKSLKDRRRKELQTMMKDKSLGREERKRRMDKVKKNYDQLIAEAEA
mmetsp:Transcript_34221/g.65174  ORF Transcript_34221/g.65174 Transcript_34221/m.65174 type:complete len:546 (+) Transcript_34221:3-1640(+)